MVLVDTEILDLIDKINQVLARLEGARFQDKLHQASTETLAYYLLLRKTFALVSRLGLPQEITQLTRALQRTIMLLNQMRLAIIAVQAAMVPGAGPLAYALAAVATAGAAVTWGDAVMTGSRGY